MLIENIFFTIVLVPVVLFALVTIFTTVSFLIGATSIILGEIFGDKK